MHYQGLRGGLIKATNHYSLRADNNLKGVENERCDPSDTQKGKRFTVCTFSSPRLINEGNYLGEESTHSAAPVLILLLTLLGPPETRLLTLKLE